MPAPMKLGSGGAGSIQRKVERVDGKRCVFDVEIALQPFAAGCEALDLDKGDTLARSDASRTSLDHGFWTHVMPVLNRLGAEHIVPSPLVDGGPEAKVPLMKRSE